MSDEIEFPPKESIHDIDLGDRKNYRIYTKNWIISVTIVSIPYP